MQQHERLDRVEACRPALAGVDVLRRLAVLAQGANGRRDRLVVRDERACVAGGAEVLGRVEAERRKRSRRTGAHAVAYRAMCLAGVLDEKQASRLGNPPQRQQVGCMTVEVDGQERAGLAPNGRCRGGRIEAVVVLRDVGDDRYGTGLGRPPRGSPRTSRPGRPPRHRARPRRRATRGSARRARSPDRRNCGRPRNARTPPRTPAPPARS